MTPQLVHATAICLHGSGVLLTGSSGSGKSDLALRLIDRGATLVSDDVVLVDMAGGNVLLRAAPNINGQIEVRGVGICSVDYTETAPLRLIIDLNTPPQRLPPEDLRSRIGDFYIPLCQLDPFQPSSAIKAELALRAVVDADRWPMAAVAADKQKVQSVD